MLKINNLYSLYSFPYIIYINHILTYHTYKRGHWRHYHWLTSDSDKRMLTIHAPPTESSQTVYEQYMHTYMNKYVHTLILYRGHWRRYHWLHSELWESVDYSCTTKWVLSNGTESSHIVYEQYSIHIYINTCIHQLYFNNS